MSHDASEFDDALDAAAESIWELHGRRVIVHPDGGGDVHALALVDVEGPKRQQAGARTVGHELVIQIRKSEVSSVTRNSTDVTVPGDWVGQSSDVRLRVGAVLPDRADPTAWRLALSGGR